MANRSMLVLGILVLGLLGSLVGCETSQPGVKNTMGTVEASVAANPPAATAAARRAVEDLKLANVSSTATELDGKVYASTARNEKVEITLTKAGEGVSRIKIRVGDFGDEPISMAILSKTQAHVAAVNAPPVTK